VASSSEPVFRVIVLPERLMSPAPPPATRVSIVSEAASEMVSAEIETALP
jgi:hypothetical protein